MQINELKLLSMIIYSVVFALCSESQCMDPSEHENNVPNKNHQEKYIPIGTIIQFSGDIAPNGWLLCDGKQYSNLRYPKLYETIKEKYVPNGSWIIEANKKSANENFFCVPNLLSNYNSLETQLSPHQTTPRARFIFPNQDIPTNIAHNGSTFYLNHIIKY